MKTKRGTHCGRHDRDAQADLRPGNRKLLGVSLIGESTECNYIGKMVLDNGLTIDELIEQVFHNPG